MIIYALTILLSAFFLFQVQPLIGKYILPWFGGTPAVWTTCMLFFQVVLLFGYAYAHLVSSRLKTKAQSWVHIGLLLTSLVFLPIAPAPDIWKPSLGQSPNLQILLLLTVNIGIPYLMLSSTAPLIQRWFNISFPGRSPYRLYALSNASSLLALLSYPFIFEPMLKLDSQITFWSWGYAIYVFLACWCALKIIFRRNLSVPAASINTNPALFASSPFVFNADKSSDASQGFPSVATMLMWVGLAAFGSIMLLATTNQLCQEIAVVPFLWVLPLSLYLLTFIISFDNEKWYDRRWFGPMLVLAILLATEVLFNAGKTKIWMQILFLSVTLFICCMTCHGEMVKSKPTPRHLTLFYLLVAAGGALGGIFVSLVAPQIFSGYWEYHIALAGCCLLTGIAWYRDRGWTKFFRQPLLLWTPLIAVQVALVLALGAHVSFSERNSIYADRNFFGILRVREGSDDNGPYRWLQHGRILHGLQYLEGEKRSWPTSYYGTASGVGLALRNHPRRLVAETSERSLRVGVVGLATGTIAAYGQIGDYFKFYEINPEVLSLSRRYFNFIENSGAAVDFVLGDARTMMEHELMRNELQDFDVLVVDAFSGDAIPVHLVTLEAVYVYWRHLKSDGLLLLNISNNFVDLNPVVRGLAERLGCYALRFNSVPDKTSGTFKTEWIVLTKNEKFINNKEVRETVQPWLVEDAPPFVWTDDFASLWAVIRF